MRIDFLVSKYGDLRISTNVFLEVIATCISDKSTAKPYSQTKLGQTFPQIQQLANVCFQSCKHATLKNRDRCKVGHWVYATQEGRSLLGKVEEILYATNSEKEIKVVLLRVGQLGPEVKPYAMPRILITPRKAAAHLEVCATFPTVSSPESVLTGTGMCPQRPA